MSPITTGRIVFAAAAIAALVGAGSCKKPEGKMCSTGIFCPAGWECAANTAQCIQGLCGNGHKDPGEACDDGGTTDGDLIDGKRCSADCQSDESCGNTHIDTAVGEVCDPPGDDCSADCKSTLLCGNHTIDPPREQCDPGYNNIPVETTDCNLDCTYAHCGDAKVNRSAHEDCDRDGTVGRDGTPGADGQSLTCNTDCTNSRCGDHKVNPLDTRTAPGGEQCDDGDGRPGSNGFNGNSYNANCLPNCTLSVCGDNHPNNASGSRHEDCDTGADSALQHSDCPYATNQSQASCTLCSMCKNVAGTPHYCGDTTKDIGHEACDLGSFNGQQSCPYGQASCSLCLNNCQTSQQGAGQYCGDNSKNGPEDCDNPNSVACGTCGASNSPTQACRYINRNAADGEVDIVTLDALAGVTLTLTWDINPTANPGPVVFEFVEHGKTVVTPGAQAIEIDQNASINNTANNAANAIRNNSNFNANANNARIVLTNKYEGGRGNSQIVVDVADANASPPSKPGALTVVKQMTGGIGCRLGEGCHEDRDCINANGHQEQCKNSVCVW